MEPNPTQCRYILDESCPAQILPPHAVKTIIIEDENGHGRDVYDFMKIHGCSLCKKMKSTN